MANDVDAVLAHLTNQAIDALFQAGFTVTAPMSHKIRAALDAELREVLVGADGIRMRIYRGSAPEYRIQQAYRALVARAQDKTDGE